MLRPLYDSIQRLDFVYQDRPYFEGIKARLLAAFDLLLIVFIPVNVAKILWADTSEPGLRILFNLAWMVSAIVSLILLKRGRLFWAGNILVLGTIISANLILLFTPFYPQPVALTFQLFILDFVILLLALVFASRWVGLSLLGIILMGHFGMYLYNVRSQPLAGSLEYAADVVIRDGLIALGFVFCLGALLVSMIESAHRRSEQALKETRALNENLEKLVAERTNELRAAYDLAQEDSRAKGDFLANMSHEIRTPLNGIIATADILRRRSDLPEGAGEQVRIVADSGELLLKLISDILDFSKIEAGRMVLERHPFDLASLVNDTGALLAATASEKRVDLDCNVQPELAREYEGDSFRLRQVLLNLGTNAIKFTPTGGQVRITVTSESAAGGAMLVRFEVKDTGIGMDDATIQRIFERFTQADSTTTRRYGGTGLGLAISARIVDALGGKIYVKSTLDQGSAFYFSLPLKPVPHTPARETGSASGLMNLGMRILVVEDNSINRKILGIQLKQLGCVCAMAVDGEEALIALEAEPIPDVVLMDCHMPRLDGWETTRRIRGWATDVDATPLQRRIATIPVIALTAAALPEERARCMEAGMSEFLPKPVKLDDLMMLLKNFRPATDAVVSPA